MHTRALRARAAPVDHNHAARRRPSPRWAEHQRHQRLRARQALVAASTEVEACERALSRFDPASDLSRLNAASGEWVEIDLRLERALRAALRRRSHPPHPRRRQSAPCLAPPGRPPRRRRRRLHRRRSSLNGSLTRPRRDANRGALRALRADARRGGRGVGGVGAGAHRSAARTATAPTALSFASPPASSGSAPARTAASAPPDFTDETEVACDLALVGIGIEPARELLPHPLAGYPIYPAATSPAAAATGRAPPPRERPSRDGSSAFLSSRQSPRSSGRISSACGCNSSERPPGPAPSP